MSSRRRQSSRKCSTKQIPMSSDSSSSLPIQIQNEIKITRKSRKRNHQTLDTNSSNKHQESPDINNVSTTKKSNKRTRVQSVKLNNKKKTEIVDDNNNDDDDDDEDIEEILPENKSNKTLEIERCPICLDDCDKPKQLDKCSHVFCTNCIDHYFASVKPQCPCCFTIYGEIRGNQPVNGTMNVDSSKHRLPGFENDSRGTIRITYHFPNGIQDESHPNPGTSYYGTTRQAYLPNNRDGRYILGLLQKAFELRQIFTVGQSRTTGYDNVITWNDIHHKTNIFGGVENFGYPDKTYLNRVKQELAAKGIK